MRRFLMLVTACVLSLSSVSAGELEPVPDTKLEEIDQSTYTPPVVVFLCASLQANIDELIDEMNAEVDENWPWEIGQNQTWNLMLVLWDTYQAQYLTMGCNLVYGPFPDLPTGN